MARHAASPAMTSAAQTRWKALTGCTAAVPRMTTTTATPTALPTWRAMVSTALPVVARSGGSAPAAANSVPATAGSTRPNRALIRPALTAKTAAVAGPGAIPRPAFTAL
jgi:hypothetical protein